MSNSTKSNLEEAKYILRKSLTIEGADLTMDHLWIWEGERWKELVFSLLSKVIDFSENEIRNLVNDLQELELLNIETLSSFSRMNTIPDFENLYAHHILELFQENGISEADAKKGVTVMCEAALGLQEHYSGKVQRYLRHYGELMVKEINQVFRFSELSKNEVEHAITYWLQNVLNLPLSLADENVEKFCEANNITVKDLYLAADELDMNFALVDDIAQRHLNIKRISDSVKDNDV
jgi:hypothetical protein